MSTVISTWEGHEETREELLQVARVAAVAIKAVNDKGYCVVNAVTRGMNAEANDDPIIDTAVKAIQVLLDLIMSYIDERNFDNQLVLDEWRNVVSTEIFA